MESRVIRRACRRLWCHTGPGTSFWRGTYHGQKGQIKETATHLLRASACLDLCRSQKEEGAPRAGFSRQLCPDAILQFRYL